MFSYSIIFALVLCYFGLCPCLKVIPERARMLYNDEQYFDKVTLNVRRSKRGGDYIINLNFTVMQPMGNNFTVSVYFYEYLHNEYKLTFVQLHYKLCDLILKENPIQGFVRRGGIVQCPLIPGVYIMKNLYFNEKIPSVFPFEKGMFQVEVTFDAKSKSIIAKGEVMISLQDNIPAKQKSAPGGKK